MFDLSAEEPVTDLDPTAHADPAEPGGGAGDSPQDAEAPRALQLDPEDRPAPADSDGASGDGDDGIQAPTLRPGRRLRLGRGGELVAVLLGGIVLGGALVALAGAAGASSGATPSASPAPSPSPSAATERFVNGATLGDSTAPITVEIWADYQCPFCRLEDVAFGGALERELAIPGKVRIEYHDFAFLGQESVDAAVAARCAGRQDPAAYWRYHDLLFAAQQGENQGAFSRANLVALATAAGIDTAPFTSCLDDPTVAQAVTAETSRGRTLGISSTPTMRITGPGGTKVIEGFSGTWTAVSAAIDAVASPAPSGAPASGPATASPGTSGQPATSPPAGSSGSPGASISPSP